MTVKKYFQKFLRQIPNILTLYRIAAAVAIMFMPPYETAFYVVYAMAGVSDLFDGVIARALKSDSRFGSTADTVADVLLTLTGTHVVISNMQPLDYGNSRVDKVQKIRHAAYRSQQNRLGSLFPDPVLLSNVRRGRSGRNFDIHDNRLLYPGCDRGSLYRVVDTLIRRKRTVYRHGN